MRWQHAASALLIACGACGGGGGGGPDAPGTGSAIDGLEARLVTALCQSRVACGLAADQASCEAGSANALVPDFVADLVHGGRLVYSPAMGDACVTALGSIACDSTDPEQRFALRRDFAVPPAGSDNPCNAMFAGTLGSDISCETSFECETPARDTWLADDRCGFKAGCEPPGCTGECITQQDNGGTCHHDDECPPNEYCAAASANCQLTFDGGDSCDTLTACLYPSVCEDFLNGVGGTCSSPGAPSATGSACEVDSGCVSVGDSCLGSGGSGSDEVFSCVTLAGFGSACSDAQPCVPGATCTGSVCVAD